MGAAGAYCRYGVCFCSVVTTASAEPPKIQLKNTGFLASHISVVQGDPYAACGSKTLPTRDAPCELGANASSATGLNLTPYVVACKPANCSTASCNGELHSSDCTAAKAQRHCKCQLQGLDHQATLPQCCRPGLLPKRLVELQPQYQPACWHCAEHHLLCHEAQPPRPECQCDSLHPSHLCNRQAHHFTQQARHASHLVHLVQSHSQMQEQMLTFCTCCRTVQLQWHLPECSMLHLEPSVLPVKTCHYSHRITHQCPP